MRGLIGTIAAVFACACADGAEQRDVAGEATAPTAEAATEPGLLGGTPPGGLAEWVGDIRAGLEPVPEQAATDASAALRTVLDLYVTRQEYIELYWGVNRPLFAGDVMDAEVEEAERRFHVLMQLLQRPEAPEVSAVAEAVEAVRAQEAAVLETARSVGAVLDPRAAPRAAEAGDSGTS